MFLGLDLEKYAAGSNIPVNPMKDGQQIANLHVGSVHYLWPVGGAKIL